MGPLVEKAPIRRLVNTHGDGDHWFGNELVGGQEIVATDAAAAHEMRAVTPSSMVVHVPDARVVFAADVVFVGSTPVRWVGPLEGWLRALDTIRGARAGGGCAAARAR